MNLHTLNYTKPTKQTINKHFLKTFSAIKIQERIHFHIQRKICLQENLLPKYTHPHLSIYLSIKFWGSIPGRIIPKTLKMVLDIFLLNTQQYKVLSRVKWSNPRKGVAPSYTSV